MQIKNKEKKEKLEGEEKRKRKNRDCGLVVSARGATVWTTCG